MSKNVLVADDDKAIRSLLVKTLEVLGVKNATEAADGNEALSLFQENEFDLILLDWDMPGKTGLEVLQAIRGKDSEIPVVMVTADNSREHIKEAVSAGVTHYLIKPFDQDTLKEKLTEYCQSAAISVKGTMYRCRHVMNSDVVTIRADASVGDAVALLLEHGISGLPVVDDQNQLLGIVSEFSLIQSITCPELNAQPINSVMSTDVMTVTEDTIPLEAVNIMQTHRIRRVPVVRDGKVVGLISRRDILRYVTENEEALREFLDEVKAVAGNTAG